MLRMQHHRPDNLRSDDARSLALAAVFSSHLSKPVDMDKLLEAVIYAVT